MKSIIVAYGRGNRVIGNSGKIPWLGKLPIDMRRVRDLTNGQAIIMGRSTYESIGRPLPNRQNIVLTSSDMNIDDVIVVRDISGAFLAVDSDKEAFVFGGARVYESTIDLVDRIYATEVMGDFVGDAFFPEIDMKKWREVSRKYHSKDENNKFDVAFIEYRRR